MADRLFEMLRGLPPELIVLLLSALPISEVRGGIPAGIVLGLPLWQVLLIAITANVLVVIPVILGFNWAAEKLADKPLLGRVISRLLKRARAQEHLVARYGTWAITLFVGIPLPMTGAWTGAVVAAVFGLKFNRAVLCMFLGVLMASTIVTALTLGGVQAFNAIHAQP